MKRELVVRRSLGNRERLRKHRERDTGRRAYQNCISATAKGEEGRRN